MTDKPKPPETPGMAEVSAKFVDEAEAAAGAPPSSASVPDDPLLALRAERQGLIAELEATPEDEDAAFWPRLKDVEKRILTAEPQTLLGALAQIEVLASMADEGLPEFAMGIIAGMNEQIPARIERLLAASLGEARAVEDPVLALKREWDARWERYESETDDSDKVMDPLHAWLNEAEFAIHRTPATTPAGIAVKLKMWTRNHCPGIVSYDWWKAPLDEFDDDLDVWPILSALHDLERLAGGMQS